MTDFSRPKDGMTVKEILSEWLQDNGYDGLVDVRSGCGCTIHGLQSCGRIDRSSCVCGYKVDHPDDPGDFMMAVTRNKYTSSNCSSPDQVEEVVAHPSHYCTGPIESIDAIHSDLGDEGFLDFCLGTISRYKTRCGKKPGNTVGMDVRKIRQYCDFILEKLPDSILKSTRESR